jgi:uncharacterized YigZ family protein
VLYQIFEMLLTIQKIFKGEYAEKGSKFYSFLFPFRKRSELKKFLEGLKKEYPDARHICYAFRLGLNQIEEISHDAGEPNHSAGDPILNQLRSHGISNCLAAVARIYGGTKLGLPNLRDAYSKSIENAISKSTLIEDFERRRFFLQFNFEIQGKIEAILSANQGIILKKEFGVSCGYSVEIPEKQAKSAEDSFKDLRHKGLKINEPD